ncbi:MAG: hypothetical protein ACOYN7_10380, partial [Candidatus Nanopelagicales bacterium]
VAPLAASERDSVSTEGVDESTEGLDESDEDEPPPPPPPLPPETVTAMVAVWPEQNPPVLLTTMLPDVAPAPTLTVNV